MRHSRIGRQVHHHLFRIHVAVLNRDIHAELRFEAEKKGKTKKRLPPLDLGCGRTMKKKKGEDTGGKSDLYPVFSEWVAPTSVLEGAGLKPETVADAEMVDSLVFFGQQLALGYVV
jgi:hypothetical protein